MTRVLALISLLLLPTVAEAQRVSIGAIAGATSTVFVDGCDVCRTVHWDRGYGTAIGATTTVQLSRTLGLRAEALLTERASQGWTAMRIGYHEFPVLAVLTPAGRFSGVSLLLGASTARERSCHLVESEGYLLPQGSGDDPAPPPERRERDCGVHRSNGLNFGYTGGLQYAHRVAGGRLELGVRHTEGQSNLARAYAGSSLRTRTSALTLAFSTTVVR